SALTSTALRKSAANAAREYPRVAVALAHVRAPVAVEAQGQQSHDPRSQHGEVERWGVCPLLQDAIGLEGVVPLDLGDGARGHDVGNLLEDVEIPAAEGNQWLHDEHPDQRHADARRRGP